MKLTNLLETTIPLWISESFPVIRIIFVVLMAICAVGIILIVMAQDSASGGGTNALTGQNESFYSLNKGDTREGRLKRLIVIFSIVIAVIAVLYFVTYIIYPASI